MKKEIERTKNLISYN